jgi:preprotein translocase subunit SecG
MMVLAALLAFVLEEAKDAFDLLLQIGAGTGLLFIIRWFWNRINPISEITAMVVSFIIALMFFINKKIDMPFLELKQYEELILGVLITSVAWIGVTFLSQPSSGKTLDQFENIVFPNGNKFENFKYKIICFLSAVFGVYALLFSIGHILLFEYGKAGISGLTFLVCAMIVYKLWRKI